MGKLSEEDKRLICELYQSEVDINLASLSRKFKVSSASIRNILDVRGIENKSAIVRNKINRICKKCGSNYFYSREKIVRGYTTTVYECRKCTIKRHKQRYQNDENFRQKNSLKGKTYYSKNKNKVNARIKAYRIENVEKCKLIGRNYNLTNKDCLRAKAYKRKSASVEAFLKSQYRNISSRVKREGLEFNFKLDYLLDLWHKQNGKCAVTGIPMIYMVDNLLSVSSDRIDSKLGYIVGNVQLVCRFINYAKNKYPNENIVELINLIRTTK